ncbi:isochorismatase family protein [Erwinia sp. CGal63]|uniref:isochorismatase family protein n=1 Tax=Erwinia sp. CGal63 TaxID=2919889 RepID=UPI00300ABC82
MSKALLIIDMQKFVTERIAQGIGHYPDNAIENMQQLLALFRRRGEPVVHIRHHTPAPDSPLHQLSPLFPALAECEALPDEALFLKTTSSAFSSTDLLAWLHAKALTEITVIGAVAGFCVNSTVRAGADAGLRMTVVQDAVLSFALPEQQMTAKTLHEVTLALLAAGFSNVVTTGSLLS